MPSESVLEEVVEKIFSNLTIERVENVEGEFNILPWWNGRESYIIALLKSAVVRNTTIKDIHVKSQGAPVNNQVVEIVNHSQQLQSINFKFCQIMKELVAHMMMQLSIKQLIFMDCSITEDIAAVFVEALKGDHTFHKIKLFKTEPYKYNDRWIFKKTATTHGHGKKESLVKLKG